MTIASTATWELNRDQTITSGLHLCGLLNAGQSATAEQIALGTIFLSTELLAWQHRGIIMRTRERTSYSLAANTSSFTAASDTIDVEDGAVLRNSANLDLPINKQSFKEYQRFSDKTLTGQPANYYVEEQAAGVIKVYFTPIPTEAYTFIYPRVFRTRDASSGTVTLDAPIGWQAALGWLCAWKFSVHYKQSVERVMMLKSYYDQYAKEAMQDETERGPMQFVAEPIFMGGR